MLKRYRIQLTESAGGSQARPGPNGLSIDGIWLEVEAADRAMALRVAKALLVDPGIEHSPFEELEPAEDLPLDGEGIGGPLPPVPPGKVPIQRIAVNMYAMVLDGRLYIESEGWDGTADTKKYSVMGKRH